MDMVLESPWIWFSKTPCVNKKTGSALSCIISDRQSNEPFLYSHLSSLCPQRGYNITLDNSVLLFHARTIMTFDQDVKSTKQNSRLNSNKLNAASRSNSAHRARSPQMNKRRQYFQRTDTTQRLTEPSTNCYNYTDSETSEQNGAIPVSVIKWWTLARADAYVFSSWGGGGSNFSSKFHKMLASTGVHPPKVNKSKLPLHSPTTLLNSFLPSHPSCPSLPTPLFMYSKPLPPTSFSDKYYRAPEIKL